MKIILNIFLTIINIWLFFNGLFNVLHIIRQIDKGIFDIALISYTLFIAMFILLSYKLIYKSKKFIGIAIYFVSLLIIIWASLLVKSINNVERAGTCVEFSGSWDYEHNKCEGARVESLNK